MQKPDFYASVNIFIDKLRLNLGIHDLLFRIQTIIAGKHITDAAAKSIISHSMKTKQFNTKNNEVVIKYKDNEISIVGQNTKGLNDPYLASILDSIITIFDEFNMLYYVQGLPVVIEKKNYDMKISDKNKSEKFVIEF